jgi:lysozyme
MIVSEAGLKHIKAFEGERLRAYRCSANVLTIGVGHTSSAGPPRVYEGMTITAEKSDAIFRFDIVKFEQGVRDLLKVEVSQNQFDVLVSFAFNCGIYALADSTLLKRVNAGKFDAVPAELMKWTKAGGKEVAGLVRRRRAEAKMWRGLDTSKPVSGDSRVLPDEPKLSVSPSRKKEATATAAAGGLGTVAVLNEIMPIIKDGREAFQSASPTFLIILALMVAVGAIWYFRNKSLEDE